VVERARLLFEGSAISWLIFCSFSTRSASSNNWLPNSSSSSSSSHGSHPPPPPPPADWAAFILLSAETLFFGDVPTETDGFCFDTHPGTSRIGSQGFMGWFRNGGLSFNPLESCCEDEECFDAIVTVDLGLITNRPKKKKKHTFQSSAKHKSRLIHPGVKEEKKKKKH
jgi:hypothetical protein